MKWTGYKILDGLTPLEIRRRIWVANRLVKGLEKRSDDSLDDALLRKRKKIDYLLDDLLELSTYGVPPRLIMHAYI
jgi:hypothetical protein